MLSLSQPSPHCWFVLLYDRRMSYNQPPIVFHCMNTMIVGCHTVSISNVHILHTVDCVLLYDCRMSCNQPPAVFLCMIAGCHAISHLHIFHTVNCVLLYNNDCRMSCDQPPLHFPQCWLCSIVCLLCCQPPPHSPHCWLCSVAWLQDVILSATSAFSPLLIVFHRMIAGCHAISHLHTVPTGPCVIRVYHAVGLSAPCFHRRHWSSGIGWPALHVRSLRSRHCHHTVSCWRQVGHQRWVSAGLCKYI